jgi:hypothetical protein
VIAGGLFAGNSIGLKLDNTKNVTVIGGNWIGTGVYFCVCTANALYTTVINPTLSYAPPYDRVVDVAANQNVTIGCQGQASTQIHAGRIDAGSGYLGAGQKAAVTVTALNVFYDFTPDLTYGLYVFRDNTYGGMALWLIDSSFGPVMIKQNGNLTDLVVLNTASLWQLKLTGGTVPTTVYWCAVSP